MQPVSSQPISGPFTSLVKTLDRYDQRTSAASQLARFILYSLGVIFLIASTFAFEAGTLFSAPLLLISVAFWITALVKFPKAKPVEITPKELETLLKSNNKPLITRFAKVCSAKTLKDLIYIKPGIETSRAYNLLLRDLKNVEWKSRLGAALDQHPGTWLSSDVMGSTSEFTFLYQEVHLIDAGYQKDDEDGRARDLEGCIKSWKKILKHQIPNPNRKQVLDNVATLIKTSPYDSKESIYLEHCVNKKIVKACAAAEISCLSITGLPSFKLMQRIVSISSLQTLVYSTRLRVRPGVKALISQHFSNSSDKYWTRK